MAYLVLVDAKSIVDRFLGVNIGSLMIDVTVFVLQHHEKWWLNCSHVVSSLSTKLPLNKKNLIVFREFGFKRDLGGRRCDKFEFLPHQDLFSIVVRYLQ